MTYLLGVAGGTGSGKGTITELITAHLTLWGLTSHTVSTDNCYRDFSYLTESDRDAMCFNPDLNFDHPNSVDFGRLFTYAKNLKEGRAFEYTQYDFSIHTYGQHKITVPANLDVGIIEGIYALYPNSEHTENLPALYDHRIFVATTPSLSMGRRFLRDTQERGRTLEHAVKQYQTTVAPMHDQYVYPTRLRADDIVEWRGDARNHEDVTKAKLMEIARQKALLIYEAVKSPLLPTLNPSTISISNLS